MTCTSGNLIGVQDGYDHLPIASSGAFGRTFGPVLKDVGGGHFIEVSGSIAGKLNHAHTRISLSWSLTTKFEDAAQQVLDTCTDSLANMHLKQ